MKQGKIQLTVLGGGREIGANSYLLQWGDYHILLDSGMNPEKLGAGALVPLERIPERLDAIIVTHGHFDHTGSLPFIYHHRQVKRVYVPEVAYLIIVRMLKNTARLIAEEGSKSAPYLFAQSYIREKTGELFNHLKKNRHPYNQPFELLPGIEATFFNAGHVLGSSGVVLTDGDYTFCYTGDLNLASHGVHRAARLPRLSELDFLLMESTTAGEESSISESQIWSEFYRQIQAAVKSQARVLIPAFALGRTQDVLGLVNLGKRRGLIPAELPVYLTGLGNAITEIYNQYYRELRGLFNKQSFSGTYQTLDYRNLNETYESLRQKQQAAIFIATNGMLQECSPSARLAKEMVQFSNEYILFTGYVGPQSLGYKVLHCPVGQEVDFRDGTGTPAVRVQTPHRYNVRISAHASLSDLVKTCMLFKPRNCAVIHGASQSVSNLIERLAKSDQLAYGPEVFETLILRRGTDKTMHSLREVPAVIITVGTSILTNYRRQFPNTRPDDRALLQFIEHQAEQPNAGSAELQTVRGLDFPDNTLYYFIATDDSDGELCATALVRYLEKKNRAAKLVKIEGLCKDFSRFQDIGLPNLVNAIIDIIENHARQVQIIATGGFKAETAYATLIGALAKVAVYYIHEDFSNLIQFPPLPLGIDFEIYAGYSNYIQAVLGAPSIDRGRQILERLIPKELHVLFVANPDYNQLRLTPMGLVIQRLMREYLTQQPRELYLEYPKRVKHLWGTGKLNLQQMPDPVVRLILQRLLAYTPWIKRLKLGELINVRTDEYRLEFQNRQGDTLVYRIHTPYGAQDLKIEAFPGISGILLQKLGKKIMD